MKKPFVINDKKRNQPRYTNSKPKSVINKEHYQRRKDGNFQRSPVSKFYPTIATIPFEELSKPTAIALLLQEEFITFSQSKNPKIIKQIDNVVSEMKRKYKLLQ